MNIFLAGSIREQFMDTFLECAPFRLQSMYGIDDWELKYIKQFEMFLLDSGAFTFMHNKSKAVDFDKYVKEYVDFINKNEIDYFFELDIDSIVGLKKVEEYRDFINKETGKKCIPVWHISRGVQYFRDCCKEYPYVAIGGIVTNEMMNVNNFYTQLPYFISYAHHCGAKIHGLGFTRFDHLHYCHFDSVDSTSWQSDARFGRGSCLNRKNGKIISLEIPDSKTIHYVKLFEMSLQRWKSIIDYHRCFS